MDEKNTEILHGMINRYITLFSAWSLQDPIMFLKHKKTRDAMNLLLSKALTTDEAALAHFDAHPLTVSNPSVIKVLQNSICGGPQKIDFNLLVFGLLMSEELFLSGIQETHQAHLQEKCRELMFACFPYAKNMNGCMLALY